MKNGQEYNFYLKFSCQSTEKYGTLLNGVNDISYNDITYKGDTNGLRINR